MTLPDHTRLPSLALFAGLALAVAPISARAELVISYDNPLIPVGIGPGDSFHLILATSTTTNRDAGGGADTYPISHWNTFVSTAAAASGVPEIQPTLAAANWFALVSTVSVAARDNAVVSAPVYRLDGELVATDLADLWNGSQPVDLRLTENLTLVPGAQAELVWSGSTSSGTPHPAYPLGNGTESGLTGRASSVGSGWIAGGTHERRGPGTSLRMYALSELITVAVPPDGDGDGLPDWYEEAHTDPSSSTALNPGDDPDEDGLTNLQEYQSTIPLDPNEPDSDRDGLLDGTNITVTNADPRHTAWAAAGIAYSDSGGDRTFRGEAAMGTDPMVADTDDDGLMDGVESNTGTWVSPADTGTDPLERDTDGDALLDGVETNTGTFVDGTDTGTHPLLADTDGDHAGDWYEIAASFTDPNVLASKPNIPYPLPDPDGLPTATDKPVKVFILSGQSNMVGIGYVNGPKPGSLDAVAKLEGKFPNLVDASNAYLPRTDVWYEGVVTATAKKWLQPGCGADGNKLGPELGFGQVMGWLLDEPVLIIKASQGNRGLGWDILPPGGTSFDWTNGKTYAGYGDAPASWDAATGAPAPGGWYGGKQYDDFFLDEGDMGARPWGAGIAYPLNCQVSHNGWTYISTAAHTSDTGNQPQVDPGGDPVNSGAWNAYAITNVTDVLDNFATKFPDWASQGFEIAGYAWFQGHWDQSDPYASKYEENLVRLINGTRDYYETRYPGQVVTDAPFAVATIGFGGLPFPAGSPSGKVHSAQLAVGDPAGHPEFAGNVLAVDTLPYWRQLEDSPGSQGYHYNNNAETYMLVGDALGRLMVEMLAGEDESPPLPDPMGFAIAPAAVDTTTVGMVAITAVDPSGPIEYFFENSSTSANSGWISSTGWNNSGLTNGVAYDFRVKARDALGNETGWSTTASAAPGNDVTAPAPDPMSFANAPTALGDTSVTMTATAASDVNGVEYLFDNISGGGNDSGWQDDPAYTDTGLTPGTEYTYRVLARDKSSGRNTTAASGPASATTTAPDVDPPTPNPAGFASPPAADSDSAISMTAVTGSDASGPVEYLFTETSGNPGGTSSGWQTGRSYTDTGLDPETQYTYTVRMRDSLGNTGGDSPGSSATTSAAADGYVIAADSPLVPPGVGPGQSFQLVFVTSTKVQADDVDGTDDGTDNTTVADWDSHVNAVADASGLADIPEIVWFAIVSVDDDATGPDVGIAARDHAVVSEAVYRTDGTQVASGFSGFWSSSLMASIKWNEHGVEQNTIGGSSSGRQVWTGSKGDGTIDNRPLGYPGSNTGNYSIRMGNAEATNDDWINTSDATRRGPTSTGRVYALSEVITVAGGGGGTDYAAWIAGFPGVGAFTGLADDADGDGIDNGVENYFGTDPGTFSAGLVAGAASGNTFTFTHPINDTPANDLTAAYRWSTNLTTFHDDGAPAGGTTVSFSPGAPSGGMVTVTVTVTGTPLASLYVVVEVSQT